MLLIEPEAVLETERLCLEPLLRSHAAILFPLLQDERIYRYIPQDPPISVAALEERYHRLESRLSPTGDEAWLNWAVRLKASAVYTGRVEASVTHGTAQLAYEFCPRFWGQGYATEACRRVLWLLFDGYGVSTVLADVDTRNIASIRLLERLGFKRVAHRAAADFFKGTVSDEYRYWLAAS